jgi:hypothetical protein
VILALILVPLVLWWLVRRARRVRMLAGLDANRPTFSIAPPVRSMVSRKDHRL